MGKRAPDGRVSRLRVSAYKRWGSVADGRCEAARYAAGGTGGVDRAVDHLIELIVEAIDAHRARRGALGEGGAVLNQVEADVARGAQRAGRRDLADDHREVVARRRGGAAVAGIVGEGQKVGPVAADLGGGAARAEGLAIHRARDRG